MAEYIPPGIERVPRYTKFSGKLVTINKPVQYFIDNFQQGKVIKIGETKVFITSYKLCAIPGVDRFEAEFCVDGKPAIDFELSLSQYGQYEIAAEVFYDSYEHHGYIKRDCEISSAINDSFVAKLWDIPIDKDGNCWEVMVLKNEPYYCDACNDTHENWITIKSFLEKDKSDAEAIYSALLREGWQE